MIKKFEEYKINENESDHLRFSVKSKLKQDIIDFTSFATQWCFDNSSFEFHELDNDSQLTILDEFLNPKPNIAKGNYRQSSEPGKEVNKSWLHLRPFNESSNLDNIKIIWDDAKEKFPQLEMSKSGNGISLSSNGREIVTFNGNYNYIETQLVVFLSGMIAGYKQCN